MGTSGTDAASATGHEDMAAFDAHTFSISASRSARRHIWSRPAR
ncbi:hypothetical protein SIAM614_09863 [Stappia aggregata IAM 12614]|uniref:Uncharacterized protein n=1 Tax=Roseibium aggregatum (strain ATCC 25650 / DSM 13394 / JCM 20685 / NBRC 16684 / NCIMB 2208 / IAM 12614 / B1) TaxID=384765 RepID=A0NM30_ROSAI|nr:hypothetical protein SIAM614_09863 [Stappia aggregata IAM 12614] [Roseibium aggregatum IAM 12614]